jgi:hypothetical protein
MEPPVDTAWLSSASSWTPLPHQTYSVSTNSYSPMMTHPQLPSAATTAMHAEVAAAAAAAAAAGTGSGAPTLTRLPSSVSPFAGLPVSYLQSAPGGGLPPCTDTAAAAYCQRTVDYFDHQQAKRARLDLAAAAPATQPPQPSSLLYFDYSNGAPAASSSALSGRLAAPLRGWEAAVAAGQAAAPAAPSSSGEHSAVGSAGSPLCDEGGEQAHPADQNYHHQHHHHHHHHHHQQQQHHLSLLSRMSRQEVPRPSALQPLPCRPQEITR